MASHVPFSCLGFDWFFALAMATSFLWYLFWCVLSPVDLDITDNVNWYFFVKLGLSDTVDSYGFLRTVHNWLPLVLFISILLSKVCAAQRNFILSISQILYIGVICYNVSLLITLLWVGRLVINLFLVALPIVLMLHVAAPLTSIFAPHVLWIPITISLAIYCVLWRYVGPGDSRPHSMVGPFWQLSLPGAVRRLSVFLLLPLAMAAITHWAMHRGCYACTSTPGFSPGVPPVKPTLLAHRGCGFNFPENTLAAFEKANKIPHMEGFETDVFVSLEGVLFLLHDPFLVRTTDVKERCKDMKPRRNASLLYYHNGSCPIKSLNAGRKFVKQHRHKLTGDEEQVFSSQMVPTFRDFLKIAKQSGKYILFDLGDTSAGHPQEHSYANLTLNEIKKAGIPLNKVYWLPSVQRKWVHDTYPDLILTAKSRDLSVDEMLSQHIQVANEDWSTPISLFRRLQRENISIVMYFVNSPFMFNYAWCIGAHHITTDNCRELSDMPANTLHQVCSHWWESGENPLIRGGFALALVECFLLVLWEVAKVTGYGNQCSIKRRS